MAKYIFDFLIIFFSANGDFIGGMWYDGPTITDITVPGYPFAKSSMINKYLR